MQKGIEGKVMSRPLGPNMKKFIAHKMSLDAIPAGGGFDAGLKFLTTPGALAEGWKKAVEWCDAAIAVIRQAAEPNPWKNASEEEIAGYMLKRIDERKKRR
jgi:hypothetical protein